MAPASPSSALEKLGNHLSIQMLAGVHGEIIPHLNYQINHIAQAGAIASSLYCGSQWRQGAAAASKYSLARPQSVISLRGGTAMRGALRPHQERRHHPIKLCR